jgi:hypothetical protein
VEYEFELRGTSPFLMHRDDIEQGDDLKAWREDPKNRSVSVRGDDRSPAWTWQTYLYHDDEHIVLPNENMMACLRKAGERIILKNNKTYKELTQSGLLIADQNLEFRCDGEPIPYAKIRELHVLPFREQAERVKKMGFSLFLKRAKINSSKNVRVRARFEHWSVSGVIESIDAAMTDTIIIQLFDIAGRYIGLGDWRPSAKTPGPYGMFTSLVRPFKGKRKFS